MKKSIQSHRASASFTGGEIEYSDCYRKSNNTLAEQELLDYINIIAQECGVTLQQLTSSSQKATHCLIRQLIWRELNLNTTISYIFMARLFNRNSHASVYQGLIRINNLLTAKDSNAMKYKKVVERNRDKLDDIREIILTPQALSYLKTLIGFDLQKLRSLAKK